MSQFSLEKRATYSDNYYWDSSQRNKLFSDPDYILKYVYLNFIHMYYRA